MCSVSFLPLAEGFHLLMNRDEKLTRPEALPPALRRCGKFSALYPREPGGGTWIGCNETGLGLALINWYSRPHFGASLSRGVIIPALLEAATLREAGSPCQNRARHTERLSLRSGTSAI